MRFIFTKRTIKRLEKCLETAHKLNNLRLFKLTKSLLMLANQVSIKEIADILHVKERLYDIVENGPEKYGFDCGLWNSAMIAEVIFQEFNVKYNPRYLCALLKKMGLTCQKAAFISDHLDEEKRKEWVTVTWPNILKEAKEKNAIILFGDEVSFAQWGRLPGHGRRKGNSPKSKRPVKEEDQERCNALQILPNL